MQKDANGARSDVERASFERGLAVMGSLYASFTATAVLRQREVLCKGAEWEGMWNDRPYEARGWTNFEQGVASVAALHVEGVLAKLKEQGRTAPDALRRVERPKLVDIGPPAAPLSAPSAAAHLRVVTRSIQRATFTSKGDVAVVLQLLYSFEWTMHSAMEAVLARRGGSAELTATPARDRRRVLRRETTDGVELLTHGHGGTVVECGDPSGVAPASD